MTMQLIGPVIPAFAFALLVGAFARRHSTVFIAAPYCGSNRPKRRT